VKLDVRLDRRTTAGFTINPAGNQLDYLALENGGDFRVEYDAIWEAAATIDLEQRVWIAEYRLPVAALGLPDGEPGRILGINITRDHNHRLATYDWAPIPPEFGPVAALYYGDLIGLEGIGGGTPLSLIPYALGGWSNLGDDDGFQWGLGGDVRVRLGEDVWTELTVFPDFAQTDLDDPVLNLDRFPLFLPEKRAFFLGGLQAFQFGALGRSQIFFSRRIGLDDDGNFIPVLGGLKAYGRVSSLQFGLFEVLTGERAEVAPANFSIARVRNDFGEAGHVGAIGTLQGNLPIGDRTFDPNYSYGLDGSIRVLERRLELTGFVAGTSNREELTRGHSGEARLAYTGEIVNPSVRVLWVSEDYDPKIGFVPRTNVLETFTELLQTYRPNGVGINDIQVSFAGRTIHSLDQREDLGKRFFSFANVTWSSGWQNSVWFEPGEELVEEEFEVLGDQPVAPGRYPGINMGTQVSSPFGRNPQATVGYNANTGFFGGVSHTLSISGKTLLGPHLKISALSYLTIAKRPDFEWRRTVSGQTGITVAPLTSLSIDLIAQVNTLDEVADGLVRVRWRYLPGSDLFLVYRESLDFSEELVFEREIVAKLQLRLDFAL
jgi:hypothetical protein